jgi:Ran GTPase-activating protein (RanGAP) involved in mRNA processing and transport
VAIANGVQHNTTLIRLNLRSNSIKDEGAIAFARTFAMNKNNVQELYLGYNGISIEGATALSDMLKKNTKLKKFDMQGIMLDINGVKHVADSIRHNRSLLHFKIDIDGESGSTAARALSEVRNFVNLSNFVGAAKQSNNSRFSDRK